jgi:hypothetical protein
MQKCAFVFRGCSDLKVCLCFFFFDFGRNLHLVEATCFHILHRIKLLEPSRRSGQTIRFRDELRWGFVQRLYML